MVNVYFKKLDCNTTFEKRKRFARELLENVIREENIALEKTIPLKVHFGEQGNTTYIPPENFDGIIDYLLDHDIQTIFIETNVLYGGKRFKKKLHLKTAKKHGFTRLPVIIADGSHGEDFHEVKINKKHFMSCKLGKEFNSYRQLIILSHFKGHILAGFGGAIKQLSMGHASKGGKLAMHMGIKPKIKNRKCDKCGLCQEICQENAITIDKKSYIDKDKCSGCSACVAVCPNNAVTILKLKGITEALRTSKFREKLVEYAYAAQKGKHNIYLNFLMNITPGCDCEGRKMRILIEDIGILASIDPVAIDKASYDLIKKAGKKFRGIETFDYAEKIGLGTTEYILKEI